MKMEIPTSSRNWIENAKRLTAIVDEEVNVAAEDIGSAYHKLAKKGTPTDADGDHPGRLKNGWRYRVKRLGRHGRVVELENNVEYLPYVEFGHRIVRGGKVVGYAKGKSFVRRARKKATGIEMVKAYKNMDARIKRRMNLD